MQPVTDTPMFQEFDSIILGDRYLNGEIDTDENGSPRDAYQSVPALRKRINL